MVKKSALLLSILLSLWTQAARADQYVEYGIQMLKQKNYKAAHKYFEQRLKLVPNDENAHYYKGLSAHYSGDKAKARKIYQFVIDNFPGSAMAKKATACIKMMDDAEERARVAAEEAAKKAEEEAAKNPGAKPPTKPPETVKSPVAKTPASTNSALPVSAAPLPSHLPFAGETRVHFDKIDNDTVFSAKINGKKTLVNFDPNSEKNWIKRAEFPIFGLTGNGPEWKVKVQVGPISKVLTVGLGADWEPRPKLGLPFLEDLEYEIDSAGKTLVFRSGAERKVNASDLYVVPFRRKGKDLIVDVTLKGRKSSMKIDTNSSEIRFTKTNFDQLDMQIPIFCKKEGEIYSFAIDELFLGRIKLTEPFVFVTLPEDGGAGEPEGTFGLKCFSDWRYTVDNKNNCLRFYH